MDEGSKLTFWGGAGTVTGANYLLEAGGLKILVDCGLFQGMKFADERNRDPFPYDPKTINFLLVTHAHIDHIGRIPKLVKNGFHGKIISTLETRAIVEPMFYDTLKIMDDEARKDGVLPIYEEGDILSALSFWETKNYHEEFSLNESVKVFVKDAGHVLGSAMYEVIIAADPRRLDADLRGKENKGIKIAFTGDLGNSPAPLLKDTEEIAGADYIVMESVYGDRNHEGEEERRGKFLDVVKETIKKKGTLLIPTFSLEKTQVILHELNYFVEKGLVPRIPVFLDSPLAIKITSIYKNMQGNFNDEAKKTIAGGDNLFSFPGLHFTETREESERIEGMPGPKIIMAGSGMSAGGRIVRHEKHYLRNPQNTILFLGYQAPGSLGREIAEGAKIVQIEGQKVEVRAKAETIEGYSSHKDSEHLLEFIDKADPPPKKVFVVMGEPRASLFLVQRIKDYLGVEAAAPEAGERFEIATRD